MENNCAFARSLREERMPPPRLPVVIIESLFFPWPFLPSFISSRSTPRCTKLHVYYYSVYQPSSRAQGRERGREEESIASKGEERTSDVSRSIRMVWIRSYSDAEITRIKQPLHWSNCRLKAIAHTNRQTCIDHLCFIHCNKRAHTFMQKEKFVARSPSSCNYNFTLKDCESKIIPYTVTNSSSLFNKSYVSLFQFCTILK